MWLLSKRKRKEARPILLIMLLIVGFTIVGYLTTYPTALPLYQRSLFTVEPTTYGMWLNGCMVSLCVLSTTSLILDYRRNKLISDLIIADLNVIYFIPGFLMNAIYDTDIYYMNYYALFWISLIIMQKVVIQIGHNRKSPLLVKVPINSYKWFYNVGIVVLFSGFALLVSLVYSNFKISIASLFTLSSVLELRAQSAELNIHWLIWYPVLCASMILPIWFTLAYKNKRYWQLALITITICAMYSIGANRVFIMMLFFAYMFTFLKDDDLLLIKIVAIVLLVIVIENYTNLGYPVMNVIRRLFITPNGESRFYVEFFRDNQIDYARQLLERWLNGIFNSPYSQRIPAMIGKVYLNGSNCNTGLVGYAIANYGGAGIIVGPMLYTIANCILDAIMKKVKYEKMLQTMAIIVAIEIVNCYGWAEYLILPSFLLLFYLLLLFMPPVDADGVAIQGKAD